MEPLIDKARAGDIRAFQDLYAGFQDQLRSFLYRMTTSREDADDLAQDTFVRVFERIGSYRAEASLKTWTFRIAANLARDLLRERRRWTTDAQDLSKALALGSPVIQKRFQDVHTQSPSGRYDVGEHIDFCFTCIGKTLPVDQQVSILLKDVYGFSRKEIAVILDLTEGVVKHLLHDARGTLSRVFYERCALVNQKGACHQCTELAGIFNPRQARQAHLRKIELIAAGKQTDDERRLYALRAGLVRFIDPLNSDGTDLQEVIMRCTLAAVEELDEGEV